MTTTDTKNEYVTDVEHEPDCHYDRGHLYLYRQIAESMTTEIYSDDDGEYITDAGEWVFEEQLKPLALRCGRCDAERYVVIDGAGAVVALNRDNCPRSSLAYGHFPNCDNKPCEYCGWERGKAAQP